MTGNADITLVAAQSTGFGKFSRSALGVSPECISGSQPGTRAGKSRIGVARLFEPEYCLVIPRLQQVDHANPPVPVGQARVAGAEADGEFLRRYGFLDGTDEELAQP